MTDGGAGAERRKHRRVPMKLPVRVQGRAADGTAWVEMSTCEDASAGGVGLRLGRSVVLGQVLHLALPLPQRFRQNDLTDPSYRVYTLVRSVRPIPGGGLRVGVVFLGKHPPRGADSLPGGLFLMAGDPAPVERRKFARHVARLSLRLEAEHAPGGVAVEERTITEDVSLWGAQVRATTLPVVKGAILQVQEIGGDFKTRAEVRNISIGPDGHPRLNLLFLDSSAPERMLPGICADDTKGPG
ncbi:MAG TPA: PilZ domain-containing protein [Vicinamibacteria bacterium]|nr:PilZ domain-containing protein [Vicinamibacteria bacterium]